MTIVKCQVFNIARTAMKENESWMWYNHSVLISVQSKIGCHFANAMFQQRTIFANSFGSSAPPTLLLTLLFNIYLLLTYFCLHWEYTMPCSNSEPTNSSQINCHFRWL